MLGKWTFEEKQQLLNALHRFGSNNLQAITEELQFKSVNEIRFAIKYYQRLALNSKEPQPPHAEKQHAPLDKWIQMLKRDDCPVNTLAVAMRSISHFESHTDTLGVSLKDCYEVLADLLEGQTPKKVRHLFEGVNLLMCSR